MLYGLALGSLDAQPASSINLSGRGVYFAIRMAPPVGQVLQIQVRMPKRITGQKTNNYRFTGRVTHVDPLPDGNSRVGVHFLYYEAQRSDATPTA